MPINNKPAVCVLDNNNYCIVKKSNSLTNHYLNSCVCNNMELNVYSFISNKYKIYRIIIILQFLENL